MSDALRYLLQPFENHLSRGDVTDIVVNRPNEFGVEASGRWEWFTDDRLTFENLDSLSMLAAFHSGRELSPSFPICEATLPDGERTQICRPPVTPPNTISLSIRSPSSFNPSMEVLTQKGMFAPAEETAPKIAPLTLLDFSLDKDIGARLSRAVLEQENIWIVGATGSGKSTLLTALIELVPVYERVITIADTDELTRLTRRNRVSLVYPKRQGSANVSAEDLVDATKRMRPDRVMMQELRDSAAFAFLMTAVAGCRGCMATLHARSARGAFDAIRLMVRRHPDGRTMSDADVRDMLYSMIDVVVHCEHDAAKNTYRVTEIYERGQPQ